MDDNVARKWVSHIINKALSRAGSREFNYQRVVMSWAGWWCTDYIRMKKKLWISIAWSDERWVLSQWSYNTHCGIAATHQCHRWHHRCNGDASGVIAAAVVAPNVARFDFSLLHMLSPFAHNCLAISIAWCLHLVGTGAFSRSWGPHLPPVWRNS